jgi:hypothetical protein
VPEQRDRLPQIGLVRHLGVPAFGSYAPARVTRGASLPAAARTRSATDAIVRPESAGTIAMATKRASVVGDAGRVPCRGTARGVVGLRNKRFGYERVLGRAGRHRSGRSFPGRVREQI